MLFTDSYKTIRSESRGLFKDRGSKFISIAVPVTKEKDCKAALEKIKAEFPDAEHHCFAFIIGPDKSGLRFNDDGEPSNSAGRPILRQIQGNDLTNVLVVVVRYFGGKLLGVPGLINAYGKAAEDALKATDIIEKKICDFYQLTYDYQEENNAFRFLKNAQADIVESHQNEKGCIIFSVNKSLSEQMLLLSKEFFKFDLKYLYTE